MFVGANGLIVINSDFTKWLAFRMRSSSKSSPYSLNMAINPRADAILVE